MGARHALAYEQLSNQCGRSVLEKNQRVQPRPAERKTYGPLIKSLTERLTQHTLDEESADKSEGEE